MSPLKVTDMLHSFRRYSRKLFEWWITFLQRYAFAVIVIILLSTGAVLYYSIRNFAIDTDLGNMISDKLSFRKDEIEFRRAFPQFSDMILVVVEAGTIEGAFTARKRLAGRLREEKSLFKDIYEPGGGSFFDKNGLLYLDTNQLQDLTDNLAAVQPFLAILTKDMSMERLFSVLETTLRKKGDIEIPEKRADLLFDGMDDAFAGVLHGRSTRMSWQRLMAGESAALEQRRQFIMLQPAIDHRLFDAAQKSVDAIPRIARELGLDAAHGVRVRLTGSVLFAHENLKAIRETVGIAILASFILVAATLSIGVGGSPLFTAANMLTLAIGLVWTLGFAIAVLGPFNLISITFGVIYIGVGIDFSLLFCLIYREYIRLGKENAAAVTDTALNVGKGLFLCMATEAIGFYSFVPTAYAGASNLGLITGTGMIINLAVNFAVLPALLTLVPLKREKIRQSRITGSNFAKKIAAFPQLHAKWVAAVAAVLGLGSAALLPRLHFDYNPLNLYDPASEAVMTAKELFRDSGTSPWTVSVLAERAGKARETAERLRKLREVNTAVTIFDFIPKDQEQKLAVISEMALLMPPFPASMKILPSPAAEALKDLSRFQEQLKRSYLSSTEDPDPHAAKLNERIREFKEYVQVPCREEKAFSALGTALLGNLPILVDRLALSLQAAPVGMADLPRELMMQYVSVDGRYRVQVFPNENIAEEGTLKRFVKAVRTVAPHATDTPVFIYESGKAVVSSFSQATLFALIAITLFLLLGLRSSLKTALILVQFALAFLMTAASSVLLRVPLNFANIIVLPLLLGLGIDNGIHFIYRHRRDPSGNPNILRTSTSRAVYYNTATSVVGFCPLAWVPHRGLASMGIVLTLCMVFVMICSFTVLPALMELFKDRLEIDDMPAASRG